MKVIPIHYIPSMHVGNWLAIRDEAEAIASFIDGKDYGPHQSGIFALHHSQVNEKPFNFFVLNIEALGPQVIEELGSRYIVNPVITHLDDRLMMPMLEGCVSFPYKKQRRIDRAVMVQVAYEIPDPSNSNGLKLVEKMVERTVAQIFQHEIDHSNGKNIHYTSPK